MPEERNWGVFVDRDGTLVVNDGYLDDPAKLVLYPQAREMAAALEQAGARLLLVTNQSGVARGYFSEETLAAIHERLQAELGNLLDSIYYCPHHPEIGAPPYRRDCRCRKPEPGMIERGLADWGLNPRNCYMIGDSEIDVIAARKLGLRAVIFLNGLNTTARAAGADYATDSLLDAARWVLEDAGRQDRAREALP